MKSSKKLIVGGLIGMLGIVAATTATSGVAWFTTTRTASVTLSNFVATAAEGNLQIANGTVINETNTGVTNTVDASANTVAVSASGTLTDVSSINGVNFFKVSTVNGVATTRAEENPKNSINNTLYNYYAWDITVTNSSTTAPMDIYLSQNGDIFADVVAETPTNKTPQEWYRMCIFHTSISADNLVFAYGQESVHEKKNKGIASTSDTTGTSDFVDHLDTCEQIDSDPSTASVTTDNQLLIKNLVNATPKTLIFVVWCEGLLTPPNDTGLQVTGAFNLIGFNHSAS